MTVKSKKLRKTEEDNSTMSLVEFKAWLKGVEEMQGADWSPTRDQWILIRNRLQSVMDNQPTHQATHNPVQSNQSAPQIVSTSFPDLVPAEQFFQPYQPHGLLTAESPTDVINRALQADPNSTKISPFA